MTHAIPWIAAWLGCAAPTPRPPAPAAPSTTFPTARIEQTCGMAFEYGALPEVLVDDRWGTLSALDRHALRIQVCGARTRAEVAMATTLIGVRQLEAGDTDAGLASLRHAADVWYEPMAHVELGMRYLDGDVVRADPARAWRYLSAAQGIAQDVAERTGDDGLAKLVAVRTEDALAALDAPQMRKRFDRHRARGHRALRPGAGRIVPRGLREPEVRRIGRARPLHRGGRRRGALNSRDAPLRARRATIDHGPRRRRFAPCDRPQPTEGLTGVARFAVPLLGRWNTSSGSQRVVMGFVRQVSHRWIQAAMSNRLVVEGEEHIVGLTPPRGLLMVANHRTFWDMYVATSVLGARTPFIQRLHFPVRSRFFYTNVVGVGINLAVAGGAMWPAMFGGFDRHGRNAAAIQAVVQSLEAPGTLVGVHPEGTRNKGADPLQLLPAKGGAGRILQAVHPDVLVLPYFLSGLTNDLPREIRANFRAPERRGPPIRIAFGEPVPAGALDRSGTPRDASERLLERIRALAPGRADTF
ncbi:MAG: lysophospholipid acyltransferase family protein [Myxococcota bacterium]